MATEVSVHGVTKTNEQSVDRYRVFFHRCTVNFHSVIQLFQNIDFILSNETAAINWLLGVPKIGTDVRC